MMLEGTFEFEIAEVWESLLFVKIFKTFSYLFLSVLIASCYYTIQIETNFKLFTVNVNFI